MSKTIVCANFGKCRTVLKEDAPREKVGPYTYCEECAKVRKNA